MYTSLQHTPSHHHISKSTTVSTSKPAASIPTPKAVATPKPVATPKQAVVAKPTPTSISTNAGSGTIVTKKRKAPPAFTESIDASELGVDSVVIEKTPEQLEMEKKRMELESRLSYVLTVGFMEILVFGCKHFL